MFFLPLLPLVDYIDNNHIVVLFIEHFNTKTLQSMLQKRSLSLPNEV